jgi:hypothetical protein
MKKLIVLLLALAMVGAVSAQVTTSVSLSGSVYLWNQQAATQALKFAPNGSGYDVLTLAAQNKDGTAGLWVKDTNLFASPSFNVDCWAAWYKVGAVKTSLGSMNGGSYVQYLVNGWLGNYGPTDSMYGYGVLAEATVAPGATVAAYYPLPLNGASTITTALETSSIGVSYNIPKTANIVGQVNLGLVANNTTANVGFDYTGMPGLDAYGWFEFQQSGSKLTAGIGGQYVQPTWRVGAEFEGINSFAAYDVIASARYYVQPTLFVQVRPEYRSTGRIRVRGMVDYLFGNGFVVEPMVGYDVNPVAGAYNGLVSYVRFTYSLSM